jgi:phospholipid/cholesterol/gamma-HCH transport system substrate-binding protein
VDELDTAIHNVNKFLGGVDTMETSIDCHSEYLTGINKTKTFAGIRIQPGLDRYYELAVIDDPKGARSSKYMETSTNGGPTDTYQETTTYSNRLKFTALFAKNFYDLTVKGGIIESSGGFGFDYHLFNHRLTLSTEIFDVREVYIRAFARYSLFKGVYVIAGGDNLANSEDGQAAGFVGAGIFITNDDLKAIATKLAF